MQHTITVLLHDRPGVLHRAVSLLRRRGYNIASLAVGTSELPGVSRMTVVVDVDDATPVVRQLERLIDVLAVHDLTHQQTVQRETVLARVAAPVEEMARLAVLARHSSARVVDVATGEMILELTDTPARVTTFLMSLGTFAIMELVRTGRLAMVRGSAPSESTRAGHDANPEPYAPFRWQADGAADPEAA